MYFALRVSIVARNRATEDYVSLRLFMRVAHNKDFRISTQRLLCWPRLHKRELRETSAVIECDYNWKFHDEYPRFFEKPREVSLDRIRSRELRSLRSAKLTKGTNLRPIFSPFRLFFFFIYRRSLSLFCPILSSDFNSNWEKVSPIVLSILVLLATTAFEGRKIN